MGENRATNRAQTHFYCELSDVFPCIKKPKKPDIEKEANPETTKILLEAQLPAEPQADGVTYRDCERIYPSAPTIEEFKEIDPDVYFHRQYSQPVQATS